MTREVRPPAAATSTPPPSGSPGRLEFLTDGHSPGVASTTSRSELRRFVRDLRWIVPLWLVVAIGFGVYAAIDDGVSSGLMMGGGCVVLGIALAPIIWIRKHGRYPSRPSEIGGSLKRIGLAVAWAIGVGLAFAVLVSIVD
jgi:hypothetical protein